MPTLSLTNESTALLVLLHEGCCIWNKFRKTHLPLAKHMEIKEFRERIMCSVMKGTKKLESIILKNVLLGKNMNGCERMVETVCRSCER